MREKGLMPWRRRGLLPGFFDFAFDTDDLFDVFNLKPIKANLRETDKEYVMEADLPGYKKDNIEIRFENDLLTINAKYDEVTEEKSENFIQRECRRGNCSRSFQIPSNVKIDSIKANFKDGVLKIVLPKAVPTKPSGKTIDIE